MDMVILLVTGRSLLIVDVIFIDRYSNVFGYVRYLVSELGCQIAIKDFVGFITKDPDLANALNAYYIHRSSFCMYIKSNKKLWDYCLNNSQRLHKKCETIDGYFIGTCYSGVSEMVIPVKYEGRVIAALCLYGFELNERRAHHRIAKVSRKYRIDKDKALRLYTHTVTKKAPDYEKAMQLCGILAEFFIVVYRSLLSEGKVSRYTANTNDASRVYHLSNAIEYIRLNYANDIKIADIAAFCHCSVSYMSHLFKAGMNQSINHYINQVRIDKAKDLILRNSYTFYEISGKCGFSDPNYFSSVFRRITGQSPSQYKKSIQR